MSEQNPQNNMLAYAKTNEGIRLIAKSQRGIILCILASFLLFLMMFAGGRVFPPVVILGVDLIYLGVNVMAMVFVFMLTTKLYGTGIGILLGILTLIPCIGLITLLVINGKATALLKEQGIKVGLLGAKVPDHI